MSMNLGSHFSARRLEPYKNLLKCNTDEEVLSAYFFMAEISTPLLTVIHILEITLRNRLNDFLSQKFGSMWFNSIPISKSAEVVKYAKSVLNKRKNGNYDENDVISNLGFGFWVHLLSFQDYTFWDNIAIDNVFPNKGHSVLSEIFDKFRHSVDIRNRLCHHEPMWKDKKAHSMNPDKLIFKIKAKYKHLLFLLNCMSPCAVDVVLKSGVLGFTDLNTYFDFLYHQKPLWSKYLSVVGGVL